MEIRLYFMFNYIIVIYLNFFFKKNKYKKLYLK